MTSEPFADLVASYADTYMIDAGVMPRYIDASPSDFSDATATEIESAAVAVLERRENVLITGAQGRGKSHLAAALVREIATMIASNAERIERVAVPGRDQPHHLLHSKESNGWIPGTMWALVPKALKELRQSYAGNGSGSRWDELSSHSIVVLDDIGGHKVTDWTAEVLYTLIAERYDHPLPTIATTNLSQKELAGRIDARLASRLVEGVQIVVTGEDRRIPQ